MRTDRSLRRRLAAFCLALATALLAATATPATAQAPAAPLTTPERGLILETLERAGEPAPANANDASLTAILLRHATVELGQRIRPSDIDRAWALEPARRDVAAEFAAARAAGRLREWLAALSPPYPGYEALRVAARRYGAVAAQGGWPSLPAGPVLKVDDRGDGVLRLRGRLAAEGYAPAPLGDPALFDAPLREALKLYQRRHDLEPDGRLSAATRASLNVPARDRAAQIDVNLERWRWLPHALPPGRIEVDIGAARATLFQGGAPALTMRVVVGDPAHPTPMFASALEAVVFNPPWNVPSSIAEAEILPKAAKDPGYLARNDFVWLDGRLQQKAGPKSALGLVKFDLQSPFGVYLHDTPSRAAFERRDRALSHGCMRVELPQALALRLLQPQGWDEPEIRQAIAARKTLRTPLKARTPLYVTYWTAEADATGAVTFRPDVYGWDARLETVLASLRPAGRGSAAPDAACGD